MNPESIALAFNDLAQGGSSDKVYNASITEGDLVGGWTVTIAYGRRGSALMSQMKCADETYDRAKKLYDKVVREKKSKGYIEEGKAPAPQVAPSGAAVADIKPPELLEEIVNGDHLRFLDDPAYWMQDKSDGVSRGVVKANGEIFGINKRGLPVPLPAELVGELSLIQLDTFQIDAELVGNKLIVRDILVANEDLSALPYYARFARLGEVIWDCSGPAFTFVKIVETWIGPEEKAAAIVKSRAERREGVVFKLTSAPYRAGRNGSHKKYKFIKSLSAICGLPRKNGKESVELFLWDGQNRVRCGTVSLIGKPAVKHGDIVEVAYLYASAGGLLIQARLLSVRDDVSETECSTSQMIFKREEE